MALSPRQGVPESLDLLSQHAAHLHGYTESRYDRITVCTNAGTVFDEFIQEQSADNSSGTESSFKKKSLGTVEH